MPAEESSLKINLLKVNAMKRYSKRLDVNSVAVDQWENCNPLGKRWKAFEKREQLARERDKFVRHRMKVRPTWRKMFLRYEQSHKALELINYILKRYLRRKK